MTTKEWLNRGFKLNKEIEQLRKAKENAENLACNIVSGINGERVQASAQNTNENKFIKAADYSLVLYKRINKLLEVQKEIVQAISEIEDTTQRAILTARYINFQKWEEIADYMNLDKRWVHRLHNKALSKIRH